MAEVTRDALQISRQRSGIDAIGLHDRADHRIGERFA